MIIQIWVYLGCNRYNSNGGPQLPVLPRHNQLVHYLNLRPYCVCWMSLGRSHHFSPRTQLPQVLMRGRHYFPQESSPSATRHKSSTVSCRKIDSRHLPACPFSKEAQDWIRHIFSSRSFFPVASPWEQSVQIINQKLTAILAVVPERPISQIPRRSVAELPTGDGEPEGEI